MILPKRNNTGVLAHPVVIPKDSLSFIIISNISQMNLNSDEFDFVELVFVGLFPYLSLTIIFLTIQAKINTFLER